MMRAASRLGLSLLLAGMLGACGNTRAPEPVGPAPVGTVSLNVLQGMPAELQMLDIGVTVFATEADPEDVTLPGAAIFAQIRDTETHYLPVALRHTLLASNQWGVVRVLLCRHRPHGGLPRQHPLAAWRHHRRGGPVPGPARRHRQ